MQANTTTTTAQPQSETSHSESFNSILMVFGLLFGIGIFASIMLTCAGYYRYQMRQRIRQRYTRSFGWPWIFNFGRTESPSRDPPTLNGFGSIDLCARSPTTIDFTQSQEKFDEDSIKTKKDLDISGMRVMHKHQIALSMGEEKMKTQMTDRLKQVGQTLVDENLGPVCKICYVKQCEVLLLPCGHVGVCETCAIKIFDDQKKCPFDKEPVTGYKIAYVV